MSSFEQYQLLKHWVRLPKQRPFADRIWDLIDSHLTFGADRPELFEKELASNRVYLHYLFLRDAAEQLISENQAVETDTSEGLLEIAHGLATGFIYSFPILREADVEALGEQAMSLTSIAAPGSLVADITRFGSTRADIPPLDASMKDYVLSDFRSLGAENLLFRICLEAEITLFFETQFGKPASLLGRKPTSEVAAAGSLMANAFAEFHGRSAISVPMARRVVTSAWEKGVIWPHAVWILLDDFDHRGVRVV